jgi:3-isopropylmalate/(R)-2-methylmalate dehydratase small subunit
MEADTFEGVSAFVDLPKEFGISENAFFPFFPYPNHGYGRNFGMGPKMNGYIAMQALGLGLVCESMPFLAYRAAIGCGLRVMTDCVNATEICDTGDELEIDFHNGFFINHTRDIRREYPPVPDSLTEIIELGGNTGWLRQWHAERMANAGG